MQSGRMLRFLFLCALFLLCLPAQAKVTIAKTEYKGWKDAYRLSNGTVELVIVPSVARIMRYGYIGGPNILWENPPVAGKLIPMGEWPNTGGDKVWPWPQDDWEMVTGKGWPPPAAADQAAHWAEIVDGNVLRMTSSRLPPWGARIVREIRLASKGTAVYLTSKIVRETDGESFRIAPWTVTQVPATAWVMARLLPSATGMEKGAYKSMSGDSAFKAVTKTPEGMLLVERNPAQATKIGTDADLLASLQGDTLFTVRFAEQTPADNANLAYIPGDRAQFYSQPDDAEALKNGTTPYIELEMTAPLRKLKKGETITLEQVWELQKLPKDRQNPSGVAAAIKGVR